MAIFAVLVGVSKAARAARELGRVPRFTSLEVVRRGAGFVDAIVVTLGNLEVLSGKPNCYSSFVYLYVSRCQMFRAFRCRRESAYVVHLFYTPSSFRIYIDVA